MVNTGSVDGRSKTALIQGASRGLGLEFVRRLSLDSEFGEVLAGCRNPDQTAALNALSAEGRVHVLPLDVADESSVARAAEQAQELVDRIDLIINVAGLLHDAELQPERRVSEIDGRNLQRSFAVNAIGPALVARYFEPLLFRSDQAVFASLSARVGSIGDNRLGGWYSYRASKAAQNMLTKTLSIEWARRQRPVICLALHPGTVATDLSRPFRSGVKSQQLFDVGRAVDQLLTIIRGATVADSGRFIAWNGETIPW